MDPLPQIPTTSAINDTVCLIRSTIGESLEHKIFPTDIATNLWTYNVDENLSLKETANHVYGVYRCLENESECLTVTELDIIKQYGNYLFTKNAIEKNQFLREIMKLRPCDIFTNMYLPDKIRYGLIEKCDLYPDATRQFLDFRFNTNLHQCKRCFPLEEKIGSIHRASKNLPFKCYSPSVKKIADSPQRNESLILDPPEIIFRNFELNTVYEETIKIKNISSQMQRISIRSYPNSPVFTLEYDACQKMAPGIDATCTLKFSSESYTNLQDYASFISRKGEIINLLIRCCRDPPKLSAYVHKSIKDPTLDIESMSSCRKFSMKRQRAVNNTIDCGTCLVTEHVFISLILSNSGYNAKFFLISEEDYCHQDINAITTTLELTKDNFWIYPTYFEILKGEVCEINILFQPLHCGFQTLPLYLMCDNNTYRQVELIGDGVCLNKNSISVGIPNYVKELEKKEGHCIFIGHITYKEISQVTLSILNRSSIYLKYALKFEVKDQIFSMSKWIKVANRLPAVLAPYSTTDLTIETECPSDIPNGYYNARIRVFITDIPIASLEAEDKVLINTNGKPLEEIVENLSAVDVLVMEVEVACYVDHCIEKEELPLVECEGCGNLNCSCTACKENIPPSDLEFSEPFLEFGILPIGIDIYKEFFITNLGTDVLNWTIVELKYNIDSQPYIEVVKANNLSSNHGTLNPLKKQYITYNIVRKKPARYVSILVLFLTKKEVSKQDKSGEYNFVAQNICVVTYEIIELNIAIKTSQSQEPILCPMQMLYTGVPVNISFNIRNFSPIPGCFYFLDPIGLDANKVEIEYLPQSGELNPGSKKKIRLRLTCFEMGILENIFLPCFIGNNQEPIQLRLLCVVDCVHVFFYLPTINNEFQKILWPPKVVYEYNSNWSEYCLCEELAYDYENTINSIKSDQAIEMNKRSDNTLNVIKNSKISITNESDEASSPNILKTLLNADSEIFLQDCIMEVRQVATREPKKITVYFENVTPKSAKYSIQSTNYAAKMNNIRSCLGPKYKKTEDMWEPMIEVEDYGILVHPEIESGYIKSYKLVSADIWIYAKTWGIYAEEIIIDIEHVTSFSFSLIIEVVGCPLQLPMSIGAITKYPTIRFGSVAYASEPVRKDFVIQNISSIDVTVSWHVFYFKEDIEGTTPFNFICDIAEKTEELFEFNFTDRFFGIEGSDCIEVQPRKLQIGHGQQLSIPIVLKPQHVKCDENKCSIRCFVLGRIFAKERDRLKSNYFYRKCNSLVIEVSATLEMPIIDVEIEDDTLRIFANDVTIKKQTDYFIKCILRNPTLSIIKIELNCSDPFCVVRERHEIAAGKCKEVHLPCILSYEKILKWAPFVYRLTEIKELPPSDSPESNSPKLDGVKHTSNDKHIDDDNKILTFCQNLVISYQGGFKNVLPLNVDIYYPNIVVKPVHVKFGYVLLDRTQKTTISIYNLTGCAILFEIYKSVSTQELVVTPAHGEIEKSSGMNHSFTTLSIFFTPTECKTYHESIRIVTNIPQYFIDIPIKGAGSFNGKFE